MKNFTILITAMLLFIFTGEAQTNFKSKNLKSGNLKTEIKKQAKKINSGFNPDGYCTASSSQCDEYIQRVQIGSIDNTTACNNYADYTSLSTTIPGNGYDIITVTNGNLNYPVDECGIWVDWNNDEDFDDSGEAITVSGSPGTGPYTATIAPEWPYIPQGDYRMRIRITYNQTPTPCGTDSWGEVEDYTIHIGPDAPNEWTGDLNDDNWNEDGNWSLGHVPTYYEDVVITNDGQYYPSIWGSDAECDNLTINQGAELQVYNSKLEVYGNLTIYGLLDNQNQIQCYGNVDWNNQSTSSGEGDFFVYGHWFFNSGANAQVGGNYGIVHLVGTQDCEIKCKSPNCSVNSLYLGKSSPATTSIASDANYPFVINGYLNIQTSDNTFENNTGQDIVVRNNFYQAGGFDFSGGDNTFVFDGDVQTLTASLSPLAKFHNLKISATTSATIYESIQVTGDLTIESGIFDIQSFPITLGGDWINNVGPGGFEEGAGRVIFNGSGIQWCSDETFNELEINNPSGALYISGTNVTCAAYDWTAGTIDVFNGGTFTANSLIDDGIAGKFVLSDASSTINLTNTNGYVDLNGEIHINNGTMNVYGGTTASYWPYAADATIYMADGVLDFHDQGIYIFDTPTYSLTDNITGGVIRTAGGFEGDRADFTPSAGTFEFYGTDDYYISQANGCTLNYVKIDKSTKKEGLGGSGKPVIDKRSGMILSPGSKSNSILLNSDFTVTYLIISSGELKLNGYSLNVTHTCNVYGTLTMDDAADVLNAGQNYYDELRFYSGSTGNFSKGIANIYGWIDSDPGSSFAATTNNTIYFKGTTGGGIANDEPTTIYGNIIVDKNPGQTTFIGAGMTQAVTVNGSFTINPDNTFKLQNNTMIIHGTLTDYTSSEINLSDEGKEGGQSPGSKNGLGQKGIKSKGGYLEFDQDVQLNGDLEVGSGTVVFKGNANIKNGAWLFAKPGGTIKLADNKSLTTEVGSMFLIEGNSTEYAALTHFGTGRYACNIQGYLAAANAIFEFMDENGVAIYPSATLDVVNTFWNCIFRNGMNGANSTLLTLNNNQNLTSNNTHFENTLGGTQYNVWKDVNNGHQTFVDATGFFAGPAYEYDPHNLIDWLGFTHGLWTGAVSSDWFTPENWDDYIIPDASTDVNIPAGTPHNPVINGAAAVCSNIDIGAGASLEIGNAQLSVSNATNVYGELIMHHANSNLVTDDMNWESGSTDDIDNGEIHSSSWAFELGTNAQLSTGNTVFINNGYIVSFEQNASFGNLVLQGTGSKKTKEKPTNYSPHISGNCIVQSGANYTIEFLDIDDTFTVENNATLSIIQDITCQNFILNGTIYSNIGELNVHGLPVFGASGTLNVFSFTCDYSLPSTNWIDIYSNVIIDPGCLLEFTDANISFAGTTTITGGTMRFGKSLVANSPNNFQPTGGTIEMIGNSANSVISITSGNFVNNLIINHLANGDTTNIYSALTVKGNLSIDKGTLSVILSILKLDHTVDINNEGILNINNGSNLLLSGNSTLNVNNGGILSLLGTEGNLASISHTTDRYALVVHSGGTISAEYALFEYLGVDGIELEQGAIVDPSFPFDHCVFQHGSPATPYYSDYIWFKGDQTFTATNVEFDNSSGDVTYNVYKNNNSGHVTFAGATGDFAGSAYEYDPYDRIDWDGEVYDLDLKAFLQGPFNSATNEMNSVLTDIIPGNQPYAPPLPYFGNPMPDWYYTGTENTQLLNIDAVDWIIIELRDATSAANATPATAFGRQAGFILNNGQIVGPDGSSPMTFVHTLSHSLFVVVWHKNHLGVLSAAPLAKTGDTYSYDFTTSNTQAYGTNAQVNLGNGIYGMRSGDANGDGTVSGLDLNNVWNIQTGTKGYKAADFNMNSQIDNKDKNDKLVPNFGKGSFVPE